MNSNGFQAEARTLKDYEQPATLPENIIKKSKRIRQQQVNKKIPSLYLFCMYDACRLALTNPCWQNILRESVLSSMKNTALKKEICTAIIYGRVY